MSTTVLFGLAAAALIGLGVYGLIVHPHPLRKIVAFNVVGGGVFLLFGVVARRGAAAGFAGDPVPHALLITGLVVAFAATALAVALLLRLAQVAGDVSLEAADAGRDGAGDRES
jgi:multicomponent Na+:H+ antiporter subunit C